MKHTRFKSVLLALTTAMVLLIAYLLVRPGLLEKEFVKGLDSKANTMAFNLEKFEAERPLKNRDFRKFKAAVDGKFGEPEYLAIFDTTGTPLFRYTLDRESELFYSLTQEIQGGKIKKEDSPMVRFYGDKKFFIVLKELREGTLTISYAFALSRKNLVRLALEIALIVLLSIAAGTAFHLVLSRSGKAAAEEERTVVKASRGKAGISDLERKKEEISASAAESLKNYVFELFTAISAGHGPDGVSLYIMDRSSSRMSKAFDMKGRSFIKIDSPDLDVIDLENEIGTELKNASTMVLSNGTKIILPVMYRNTLLGAVHILRGVPFKGMEIKDIRELFGGLARYLSEYIFYHDVVVDAATGLYSGFYFSLKYDELLKAVRKGGAPFGVMEIALFRERNPEANIVQEAVNSISKKLMARLGGEDIACLREGAVQVLLPGADAERTVRTGEDLFKFLSGLTVKMDRGRINLDPCIGLTSTEMAGSTENPLGAARQNLEYALQSGGSRVEYSKIRTI